MGYYTLYTLSHSDPYPETDYLKDLSEISGYELSGNEIKWYKHEEDMKKLSKKYPDVLFTLDGEGEESGDVWKKYFKNGKMQIAKGKIIIDEFDEKKLS